LNKPTHHMMHYVFKSMVSWYLP